MTKKCWPHHDMIVIQISVRFWHFWPFQSDCSDFLSCRSGPMKLIYRERMTEFYCIYISVKQDFPRFPKFVTHVIYYVNIYNFNSKKKGSETVLLTETALRTVQRHKRWNGYNSFWRNKLKHNWFCYSIFKISTFIFQILALIVSLSESIIITTF